ncbi:MAG: FIST C-terminal domain-containing protein [Bacteriovoracaceae bacterium]|nr:FIST C-terminal domain-containing protein [Bacteriovoracaceae bacterium]
MKSILTGHTNATDEIRACLELSKKLNAKEAKLNLVFCSRNYEKIKLSQGLNEYFGHHTVACSTAGEISEEGFTESSMVGVSLQGHEFEVDLITVTNLRDQDAGIILDIKKQFHEIQHRHRKVLKEGKTFGILLIDGLSVKEEEFVSLIDDVLKGLPLIGGSASDQLKFESTLVYANGQLRENAATLAIVTTTVPFELFKVQHFRETDSKFVITASTPKNRTVQEIDGIPAALFYAEKLGLDISELNPSVFSKNPVMLKIGDDYYVRSIQKMNPDLSLTFYCAIDNGLVLRLGSLRSITESSNELFIHLDQTLGEDKLCLSFECVLRKLEIMELPQAEKDKIMNLYNDNNVVGFHTYGEQLGGVHINQTLTGVAFGTSRTKV